MDQKEQAWEKHLQHRSERLEHKAERLSRISTKTVVYQSLIIVGGLTIFASLFYFAGSFLLEDKQLFSTGWNMNGRGLAMMAFGYLCQHMDRELTAIRKIMFSERNKAR